MTFMECLINVLVVIGYIAWFVVSVVAISYGVYCWWDWDWNWFTNILFFIGIVSMILFITTIVYILQQTVIH